MSVFDLSPFIEYCRLNNIEIDENASKMLELYGELLVFWNEKINLTAITEPEEIVTKHFIDSVSLLKYVDLADGGKLADIGSGAGFPGMVIKIVRPKLNVTLLDGHQKRFVFLNDLMDKLDLRCETLALRAELASKMPEYREQFDIVTARAVASMPALSEYCLPFVKVGGTFVAMKGPTVDEELKTSQNAVSVLGGGQIKLFKETLPDGNERAIVILKKKSHTSAKYPRASAKILKQPL